MLALALFLSLLTGHRAVAPVECRSYEVSSRIPAEPGPLRCSGYVAGGVAVPVLPEPCVPAAYYHKAWALVERVITQQEGWLNFGYANAGGFNSLEQYRREGGIRIIPVAYLPVRQFLQYQRGDNLGRYCRWDTLHFQALAYKGRKPIGQLAFHTSPDTAQVYFSCGSVKGIRIQRYLPTYDRCLFWISTLGVYCVLTNDTLMILNLRTGRLQSVDAWMQEQGGLEAVKQKTADYHTEG